MDNFFLLILKLLIQNLFYVPVIWVVVDDKVSCTFVAKQLNK